MANLKTEVILTMNGKAAIQVLEALRDAAKSVRKEIDGLHEGMPDYKERKAELESTYKTLQNYETKIIDNTERLDHAIQNLTSTSLQNLRKALGDGRRQLQKLSEDELEQAEEVRKKMKQVGDEIRLLEGQYVKIADGLKNIGNQSDQWLDKAIKQQRDLVGSLEKSDAAYQKNYSILKQLEAEEDKRRGKMDKDYAMTVAHDKYANASDLRRAKASIIEARDNTDSNKIFKIEQYNKALQEIEQRLGTISGQFVDVQKGIGNVANQSDQWLDKAIKQQRDLVGSLEKSDAGYQQNLATLKQLEAEEDRRKGKMSFSEAQATVSNKDASASDLRRAKTALTEARDNTPTSDTSQINSINKDLLEIDQRLEAVSGKAQKAAMSWQEMRQVLSAPNKASGEDIKRTMEFIQQKIQQLPAGSKAVADLRAEYTKLEQTLKGTRMSQSALNDILRRSKSGKASLDELRRAYKQLEEELNQINTKSKEFADKQKSMKNLKKYIDEVTGAANKQGGAWQTAVKNLTAYVGLFAVFNKAKEIVTGAIKKNLEYSGSLTDIRKVSGLTMQEVNKLSTELAKIDTRTSVEGLAKLAYEGSKLGMSKYGVEGLASFVRAADKINVAIGEEMGEEALPALSKMVEVMGLIPKMGIEKAMDATGSAMFKLSTTSTSTSNDIVEFAKRLTGVARTAGITTDQLLALGSASSSMMLLPEVASTAFGKFIVALQKNHNLIAKELDIPDETLKNLYASGHAMDAMVLVFEKMKQKGNMNALGEIFKPLGSDGQRLVTSMVTMAKNVDMLKDHLYESKKAFREATAVGAEYSMQQHSAIGILERANNLWEKAFVNPDGVESVKSMAQAWYDMSVMMTQSPIFKGTLEYALSGVIIACKALVVLLPAIINYLVAMGVWKTFVFLSDLTKAIKAAVTAQTALNAAVKVNPYVALVSVIATLVGVFSSYANQANKAAEAARNAAREANAWKTTLGKAAVETGNLNKKLENYKKMMNESNLSQGQRKDLISRFNKDFRSYITNLGIEIKSVKDLRKHYSELADEIKRATYYRMREEAKAKVTPKLDADRDAAANNLLAKMKALGIDKYGVEIEDVDRWMSQGAGGNAIFWNLIRKMPKNKSGLHDGFNWKLDKNGFVYRDTYDGGKAGLNVDSQTRRGMLELLSASRWYGNSTNRRTNKLNQIDKAYLKYVSLDYTPYPEEDPGTLEKEAPENGNGGGHAGNPNRVEKNVAKDRANALIANIKAFYEEQMRKYLEWVAHMNADGEKISEGQQKEQLDYLQSQMDRALGTARQSIANLGDGWRQFYSHMDEDVMVFDDETSKKLLESIGKADIGELHKLFTKLSGDLSRENNKTLAENLGALLDQIFANGSKELREAAEKLLARQREIQKILNEHDYTGAVDRNTRSNFDRLGFLQPAEDVRTDSSEGLEKMNAAFDKLTTKARESITVLYSLNPESEEFQNQFLQFLSVANDGFDFSKLSVQNLKALYLELIKYNDEYVAAEKKSYDDAKKITDFLWKRNKRNLAQQDKLRKIQNESNLFGKRTNLLSNLGLANLTADPEIELMKARMQSAEDYYAFVERNTKNKQLIDEAERVRQEAELAYANQMATAMKSRLSQMKELVRPIEDFGAAVGQALAEMRYDAESANDAIKSALKSMLESWGKMAVNDVNTQMWKAINDAGAKRGKSNAQADIDAARANAKASYTDFNGIDWRNFGTESNPLWVRWTGDHYEDKSGDVVYTKEDGTPLPNPDGSVPQTNEPPRAWQKRHPDGTIDDYNKEVAGLGGQIGSAAVDVATGNSDMGEAAAGIAMSGANALLNANIEVGKKDNKDKKNRKKELRDEKEHQKELADIKKKGVKDQEKAVEKGQKNMTQATKEGSEDQKQITKIGQDVMLAGTEQVLATTISAKKKTDDEAVKSEADSTEARMNLSLAGAVAKCFDFLGPIAGPIAAAVVTATLNGLLQWAISSAFNKKQKNSSKGPNTKVVSGMLTYDSGNVQDLRPFVGNDGSLYWATEDNKPHNGVSLLTQPTATTINGHPSLVAENGPELVIGRETTQAMMMNNPQLLKALVNYDRNYSGRRAYDNGNIAETSVTIAPQSPANEEMVSVQANTNIALLQAVNTLLQRLEQPIEAKIDMYGRGKLYDSMTKANLFMKNK